MKKCLMILIIVALSAMGFAQNVINVAPGEGTLSLALEAAVDGDVFKLIPGAIYTESVKTELATIENKSIIVEVDGDGSQKAIVQMLTPTEDDNSIAGFNLGDQGSLTVRGIEFDGTQNGMAGATYFATFYMGEFPAPILVKKINIDNCWIHDLTDAIISAGNGDMRGNVVVDSTFINNVVTSRTGTSIYYKYAGATYVKVSNSTFDTITSYGIRIAGPGESSLPDNTPTGVIDHTTWYNVGTDDGREIILLEKGPNLNQWTVSNSILVKQINKGKTVINLKDQPTPDLSVVHNICLWDVGDRNWRDHPVTDTLNVDPQFADPDNGDFTLPAGSPLLSFGDDGMPIGDPRWGTNYVSAVGPVSGPNTFALSQNYPNPFNPTTTIPYTLDESGMVSLKVFDLLGKEVAQLMDARQAAGLHTVQFDASGLTSGVYFYQLNTGRKTWTRKMTLLE